MIVSGQARHSLNPPTLGPNGSQAVRVDVNRNLTKDEHQLRIYHEYLSYLFRKPELPSQQFELELSYRDYLQVLHARLSLSSLSLACCILSFYSLLKRE